MTVLFLIIGTSLTITCSFHGLLENFNLNCISHTKLAFKSLDINAINNRNVNQLTNTSDYLWTIQKLEKLEYYTKLFQLHFNKTLTAEQENERKAGINKWRKIKEINPEVKEENFKRQLVFNEEDLAFFESSKSKILFNCLLTNI